MQGRPYPRCGRMRAAEHAPCNLFRLLERFYGQAEIVERRAVGFVERLRVDPLAYAAACSA